MSAADDRRWMRRALRQAVRSLGATAPNPGVGCVIVRDGRELAAGRHRACGGPHAEIEALDAVADPAALHGATVYVTLAPCTRHGRTPPCVAALAASGVARVVAALADPAQDDPAPALAAAGIAYEHGCEADLAAEIHGGFLMRQRHGRARVTGKWAATLDGFLATTAGHSAWITTEEARALSRRRRRAYDAIVVGADTARADDPRLTAVTGDGRQPLRVVLSSGARLALTSELVRSARAVPTAVVHDDRAAEATLTALRAAGVECLAVGAAHDPHAVVAALTARGCNEILVEGGAQVHGAFLAAGLYDRLECWWGACTLAGGAPIARGASAPATIADGAGWQPEAAPRLLGDSLWLRYRRRVEIAT